MRKLLYSVITLAALLLAAEVGVTLLSQNGMERALRSQYDLPSNLKANINSFPFLVSLTRNHLGELQLSWEGELRFQAEEGAVESIAYVGRINLFDVELSMPSLLTGKLEIRRLSRLKTFLGIEVDDINRALGRNSGGLFTENGRLFMDDEGGKTQYRVKVTGDNALTFEPHGGYREGEALHANAEALIETMHFETLPLDAFMSNASISGDIVVIAISIPMWEGYLGFLEFNSKNKQSI